MLIGTLRWYLNQVYAILDEVFLAGEISETSKQVVLTRLEHLDKLEWRSRRLSPVLGKPIKKLDETFLSWKGNERRTHLSGPRMLSPEESRRVIASDIKVTVNPIEQCFRYTLRNDFEIWSIGSLKCRRKRFTETEVVLEVQRRENGSGSHVQLSLGREQ